MRSRHRQPLLGLAFALLLVTNIVNIVAEQTPEEQQQFQQKLKDNEAAQDHGERPREPNLTAQVIDEAPAAVLASGTGDLDTTGVHARCRARETTVLKHCDATQGRVLRIWKHSAKRSCPERAGLQTACKISWTRRPMATWKVCMVHAGAWAVCVNTTRRQKSI